MMVYFTIFLASINGFVWGVLWGINEYKKELKQSSNKK